MGMIDTFEAADRLLRHRSGDSPYSKGSGYTLQGDRKIVAEFALDCYFAGGPGPDPTIPYGKAVEVVTLLREATGRDKPSAKSNLNTDDLMVFASSCLNRPAESGLFRAISPDDVIMRNSVWKLFLKTGCVEKDLKP